MKPFNHTLTFFQHKKALCHTIHQNLFNFEHFIKKGSGQYLFIAVAITTLLNFYLFRTATICDQAGSFEH